MPVTITLTDEQALDIVSQVSGMLKAKGHGRGGGSTISLKSEGSAFSRVLAAVNEMPKGRLISPSILAAEIGVSPNYLSGALGRLARKSGTVSMLQRGTWRKET